MATVILLTSLLSIQGPLVGQSWQAEQELLADSLLRMEKLNEAISVYSSILAHQTSGPGDGSAQILQKLGHTLVLDGKENEALPYLIGALTKAGSDSMLLAKCYADMGRAYLYTSPPDSALYYYEKALTLSEKKGNPELLAQGFQNMAQILRVIHKTAEAKKYINEALRLVPEVHDIRIIADIFNETAYLYELNQQLDSARYFYQRLIEASIEHNYLRGISSGYSNMASVLTLEDKFPEALHFYRLGLQIDLELDYSYYISCSYRGMADCYYEMEDYKSAINYIQLAQDYCDPSWLNDKMIVAELKYRIYKAAGDFQQALDAYERFMVLQDTLMNIDNQIHMSEILTRYETDKKENQILLLDQTNRLNAQKLKSRNLLLVILILLLGSIILVALNIIQLKNHHINQIEIELHNFVSRMNTTDMGSWKDQKLDLGNYSQAGLTQRESEILQLMQKGLSNREIGEKLFVSENTIKFHLKNIYIKLDVKNRTQAANLAI